MINNINAYQEMPISNSVTPIRITKQDTPFNFPPHFHKEVEIIYVQKGLVQVNINHKIYEVFENELLIIGCNHIHSYIANTSETEFNILLFDWTLFKHFLNDKNYYNYLYPLLFNINYINNKYFSNSIFELDNIFCTMYKLFTDKKLENELLLVSKIYQLMSFLTSTVKQNTVYKKIDSIEKEQAFISKINKYIFNHYHEGISLEKAASISGYSVYHFSRQFKKYTGMSFKQYLTIYQISMAKEDLHILHKPITEIAYDNGFKSIKTFNRVFKNYYKQSPSEYRKAINKK